MSERRTSLYLRTNKPSLRPTPGTGVYSVGLRATIHSSTSSLGCPEDVKDGDGGYV